MEWLDTIKSALENFLAHTGRVTIVIIFILVLFLSTALVLLIGHLFQGTSAARNIPTISDPPFSTEDEFLPPDEMTLTEDYYFSRTTEESWTRNEADQWFFRPNDVMVDQLGHANDLVVDDILGAAP